MATIDCYVRNSTVLQVDNWRAEYQKIRLPEICRAQGYEPKVWEEQGQSGESLEKRVKMMTILDRVRKGTSAGIACVDFGRLSRDIDMEDGLRIWKVCKDAGAIIVTPQKTWDPANSADNDFAFIMFWFESRNKRDVVRKLTDGLIQRAEFYPMFRGTPPYGYEKVLVPLKLPNGKIKNAAFFRPIPDQAEVIVEIYRLYVQFGLQAIRNILNERVERDPETWGYRSPFAFSAHPKLKGAKSIEWTVDRVQAIVTNDIYRGIVYSVKRPKAQVYRQQPGKTFHLPELQVVPDDLARTVDAIRKQRTIVRGANRKGSSIFAKLLVCPKCGDYLVSIGSRAKTKGQPVSQYYACRNLQYYGRGRCEGVWVRADQVVEALIGIVQDLVGREDCNAERAERLTRSIDAKRQTLIAQKENLERSLKEFLDDVYVTRQVNLPKAIVDETIAGWNRRLSEVGKALVEIEQQEGRTASPETLRHLQALRTNLREVLLRQSWEVLSGVFHALFASITVEPYHRQLSTGRQGGSRQPDGVRIVRYTTADGIEVEGTSDDDDPLTRSTCTSSPSQWNLERLVMAHKIAELLVSAA